MSLAVIILMALVTFLPRFLPLYALQDTAMPPYVKRFLSCIPFAALGALIFPGVWNAVPGASPASMAGAAAAVVVAWFRGGLVFSVLAAVAASLLVVAAG